MPKTCEELYIDRIEAGIRGLKMRTKTPEQIDLTDQFKRLKPLNPMMYEDLKEKFDTQLKTYNNNKNNRR